MFTEYLGPAIIFLESHVSLVPGEGIVVWYFIIVTCGVCFFFQTTKCDSVFQIILSSMEFESKIAMRRVSYDNLKLFLAIVIGSSRISSWVIVNKSWTLRGNCCKLQERLRLYLFIWNIRVTWCWEMWWCVRGVLKDKKKGVYVGVLTRGIRRFSRITWRIAWVLRVRPLILHATKSFHMEISDDKRKTTTWLWQVIKLLCFLEDQELV